MKKSIYILFIIFFSFIFVLKVNASSITWSYITEQLQDFFDGEDFDLAVSGNSIIISGSNIEVELDEENYYTLKNYSTKIQYKDNVISLVVNDKSKMNSEEKLASAILDSSNILVILDDVINMYYEDSEFNFEDAFNNDQLLKYGINLKYTDIGKDDVIFDVSEFSVDLNTFESAVTTSKPSVVPGVGDDPDIEDDPIASDEEVPPPTGDSTIYIIITFLILCVGLIIYKFKSLDNYNSL